MTEISGRRATARRYWLLQRGGQFERDHLRPLAQDRLAHFNGELQPSRRHRKISEAPAPQTAGIGQIRQFDFARTYRSASSPSVSRMAVSSAPVSCARSVARLFSLMAKRADVDAVAHGVALVGGVRLLQKIGHVSQDALLGERQVLFQDLILFVALRKIDEDLRLQARVDVFGQLEGGGVVVHGGRPGGTADAP